MKAFWVWLTCVLWAILPATVRADEFDSGGVKIHYSSEGKGDPVILIHGLFSSARMNWLEKSALL